MHRNAEQLTVTHHAEVLHLDRCTCRVASLSRVDFFVRLCRRRRLILHRCTGIGFDNSHIVNGAARHFDITHRHMAATRQRQQTAHLRQRRQPCTWCQAGHTGCLKGDIAIVHQPCSDIAQRERQPIAAVSLLIQHKRGRPALLRFCANREQKTSYQCDIFAKRVHFTLFSKCKITKKNVFFGASCNKEGRLPVKRTKTTP